MIGGQQRGCRWGQQGLQEHDRHACAKQLEARGNTKNTHLSMQASVVVVVVPVVPVVLASIASRASSASSSSSSTSNVSSASSTSAFWFKAYQAAAFELTFIFCRMEKIMQRFWEPSRQDMSLSPYRRGDLFGVALEPCRQVS